jgi:hypothetical protein
MSLAEACELLQHIYGRFRGDGLIDPERTVSAEQRLETKLPLALIELYLRTGHVHELHAKHNRLIDLEHIDFADDHLVFYQENQAAVVWGIHRSQLSHLDPPVAQGQVVAHDPDRFEFYPEFSSVSEFLCSQGAWQAIQGGLPYCAVIEDNQSIATVEEHLRVRIPDITSAGLDGWLVTDGVVILAGSTLLGLATRSEPAFRAACDELPLPLDAWDYASLRDD